MMEVIILCLIILVGLPVVGLVSLFGIAIVADWIDDRKYKKMRDKTLSKEDWKNGLSEGYKHWLGY